MEHSERFNSKWYDGAYSKEYNVERYRTLWQALRDAAGDAERVLDLGCGLGNLLGEWEEDPPATRIGVDFSEVAVCLARRNFPDCRWMLADLKQLAFTNPESWEADADVVFLCEVLEHVEFDRPLADYARAHARRRVLCSVPNEGRVGGRSHTPVWYSARNISERFGCEAEVLGVHRERFLVFALPPLEIVKPA